MSRNHADLERMLADELVRRSDAVPGRGPSFDDVRGRARSIRRRRVAGSTLAAAAAVVAISVPIAVLGGGTDRAQDIGPANPGPSETATSAPSPTSPTSSTSTTSSVPVEPEQQCSASGVPEPTLSEDLPGPVRATAARIVDAAMACDIEALEAIGRAMTAEAGSSGAGMLGEWEQRGEGRLGTLLQLLDTTPGTTGDITVWPGVGARPWSESTPEQIDELRGIDQGTPLSFDALVRSWEQLGDYYGWKVGIRADGTWLYFTGAD